MFQYALAPVMPHAARGLQIQRTLAADQAGVALTFDDGPHPEGTQAILDVLARARLKAMFFMVGEQVERRPQLAKEVADRGHAVALHGYRHRLQTRLPARVVHDDIARGLEVIEAATGRRPAAHRPPYGVYSPAGLELAREHGLRPLLWSRWGKDWRKFTTPGRIARRVLRDLGSGDVILLHDADFYSAKDSHRRTAEALELIVTELRTREIGTVLPF